MNKPLVSAYDASLSCLQAYREGDMDSHNLSIYPNNKGGLTVFCVTHMCVVAECVAHE